MEETEKWPKGSSEKHGLCRLEPTHVERFAAARETPAPRGGRVGPF